MTKRKIGRPFKKGLSGNPGGKSKERAEYQRQFEEITSKFKLKDKLAGNQMRPCFEVLVERLIRFAAAGRGWAMKEAMFRFLGADFNLNIKAEDGVKFIVKIVKGEEDVD